jgi:hypothetical protein
MPCRSLKFPHYKLHASVDKRYKLIRKLAVTHAAVADTTVFEQLLDSDNSSRDGFADRGYPSIDREAKLKQAGWRVHIQRRGMLRKEFPKRRSGATAALPHCAPVSSMCSAPGRKWAVSWRFVNKADADLVTMLRSENRLVYKTVPRAASRMPKEPVVTGVPPLFTLLFTSAGTYNRSKPHPGASCR